MANSKLVELLYAAWKDNNRVIDGLTPDDAGEKHHGGSSFAWTYAHAANQVDAQINVRFAGHEPHNLIGEDRFRFGGNCDAHEWEAIKAAVEEVRQAARDHLDGLSDDDLSINIPYDGSFAKYGISEINLRYAIYRAVTHHYFHIGELASKRDLLGHSVGDYPGILKRTI